MVPKKKKDYLIECIARKLDIPKTYLGVHIVQNGKRKKRQLNLDKNVPNQRTLESFLKTPNPRKKIKIIVDEEETNS